MAQWSLPGFGLSLAFQGQFLAVAHPRDERIRAAPGRVRARSLTAAALCGYLQEAGPGLLVEGCGQGCAPARVSPQRGYFASSRPGKQECRSLLASVLGCSPIGEGAADFVGIGVFDLLENP